MRGYVRFAAIVVAGLLAACLVGTATAAGPNEAGLLELTLPRRAADDEAVWVQVRVGTLPRGAEISISTVDGALLGTVSPFGLRSAGQGVSYTIPLPNNLITSGHVTLRLRVTQPGADTRAPKSGEVESVSLIYVPVTK